MVRLLSAGRSQCPAGAEAETGVASAYNGVDCVFLAFLRSFPGGVPLKVASFLPCAAGDQRCKPFFHTWQKLQHLTSCLRPFVCQSPALHTQQ